VEVSLEASADAQKVMVFEEVVKKEV